MQDGVRSCGGAGRAGGRRGRLARVAAASIAAMWLVAAGAPARPAAVPTPAETPVELVVSGRTSTLKSIRIVKTGQEVPPNFSGGRVKNTPGYTWYVSRHYALKTDMPEAWAHECLTWAELAYPHAVWVIGREPEGIERRRMVFVYGKDLPSLREATYTDGGFRWQQSGGGVTFDFLQAAYNYPSGSLRYHKRDLVIHENLHLLQACVTGSCYNAPLRFLEGITYAFANHVYDRQKKRLTVRVLDKPTVNNPYDDALRSLAARPRSIHDFLETDGTGPQCGLYTQFMWTDPDRLMRWRLWRDELFALGGRNLKDNDRRLMKAIYGDLGKLDEQWKRWLAARRSTFHYVDWGWEQVGETLWSYGWPQKTPFSQTNINLPLGEKPAADPLVMDYPPDPQPEHLVGPVKRGVAEPSVGAVLDFSRNPEHGLCGLALGVMADERPARLPRDAPGQVNVYVQAGKTLVLDGRQLGLKNVQQPVSSDLRAAMRADHHRVGLTVTVAAKELRAELRAGSPGDVKACSASLPLTGDARKRLLSRPSAVIAKDGYHGVTPLFDVVKPPPDLTKPAPPNRWRFAGDTATYRLYRAAWKMGAAAPASLAALKARMAAAMDKDAEAQAAALAEHAAAFRRVLRDIRAVRDEPLAQAGAAELLGLSLRLQLAADATAARPRLVARISACDEGEVRGDVTFRAGAGGATGRPIEVRAAGGQGAVAEWTCPVPKEPAALRVLARADLRWEDVRLSLTDSRLVFPSIPRWWIIGPFSNPGGTVDEAHPVEKGPIDLKGEYRGKGGRRVRWRQAERSADAPPGAEHVLDFAKAFKATNAAAYALVWIDSPREADAVLALGSDDGVVVWLNGKRVHANMVSRGYRSMEDELAVRLQKGRNELLIKVAQGSGEWKLCVHLLDPRGDPLGDVRYLLAPETPGG